MPATSMIQDSSLSDGADTIDATAYLAIQLPRDAPTKLQDPIFVPLLDPASRFAASAILLMSLSAQVYFWWWWATVPHAWMDLFVTILVVWATWEKLYAQLLLLRAQMTNPNVPAPQLRVAMVATKAPSEPWSMLQTTLQAMLDQDYPYPYDVSVGAVSRYLRRGFQCLSRRCRASK